MDSTVWKVQINTLFTVFCLIDQITIHWFCVQATDNSLGGSKQQTVSKSKRGKTKQYKDTRCQALLCPAEPLHHSARHLSKLFAAQVPLLSLIKPPSNVSSPPRPQTRKKRQGNPEDGPNKSTVTSSTNPTPARNRHNIISNKLQISNAIIVQCVSV